ncbi:hypothetical protein OIU78_014704 [Salix suchowensis]|nr:hypothetical protein OIU78_014704 [Salix suchowensis]
MQQATIEQGESLTRSQNALRSSLSWRTYLIDRDKAEVIPGTARRRSGSGEIKKSELTPKGKLVNPDASEASLQLVHSRGKPRNLGFLQAHTGVSIFGYDGGYQRPVGKIRIRLQIGDLTSEATFYAIRGRACYNLLLGGPRIHDNHVVPSTLHQCFKYVDTDNKVRRVFADKKPAARSTMQTQSYMWMPRQKRKNLSLSPRQTRPPIV